MSASILGMLLCYIFINSFTPGPGNLLAMNTTTRYGWRKGKKLIFGICCGYFFIQLFCTLVLYQLNMAFSSMLFVLKYAGVVYIIWLAIHIALSHPEQTDVKKVPRFSTGFLLQFLNIKIYFYITTLLTVYFIPYVGDLSTLVFLGFGVAAIGSVASLTWAFLGIKLQERYEKHYKFINGLLALSLLLCAWEIALQ